VEFKQVIGTRRSIRYFDPDQKVEKAKIQVMLEAANRSSRSINVDYTRAIVVYRDELADETIDALRTPTTTADLDLAPVYIFFYADLSYADPELAQSRLMELVDVGALNPTHGWSKEYVRNVAVAQVLRPMFKTPAAVAHIAAIESGLAINQAMLAAVDEGLGVCLHAFNFDAAKQALGPPDHWMPLWLLLVGYPAEDVQAGGARPLRPLAESFHYGRYGSPWEELPEVTEQLKRDGMIQAPAPLPGRFDEIHELAERYGLPE
jgi:nitroreductase